MNHENTPDLSRYEDLETVDSCEVCSNRMLEPFRRCREPEAWEIIPEMRGKREFRIVRCPACGLAFVNPRYTPAKLRRLYGAEYFIGEPARPSAAARTRYWLRENRLKDLLPEARLLKRFAAAGAILDAGCGLGHFADALGPGWRMTGVEWDEYAAARAARESSCIKVLPSDLEALELEPEQFDGLVMIQVLDHLLHPLKVLQRLARSVKPGGFAYLSRVINAGSLSARLFGNDYRLLAPNHPYYFTTDSLKRLLELAGFELSAVRFPFFRTPYFSPAWFPGVIDSAMLHIAGRRCSSPPAPGNFITVVARKKS